MKQVLIKQGKITVEDVPAPAFQRGHVLVRVHASSISPGTELGGLTEARKPLWAKALSEPEKALKLVAMAVQEGPGAALAALERRSMQMSPLGYSAAGTIVQVGDGAQGPRPDMRVACAGAGYANHAELISVPFNLVVPIPDGLGFNEASLVTLGAIALHGVRRAQPTLGETFVVIGLGILGQLTAQLLRASGCKVIGTDLDRRRIQLAVENGMDLGWHSDEGDGPERVLRSTNGVGADGVIIAASARTDEIVSQSFRMCRKKGRVVLVGDVGLNLARSDFYKKEIDFLISSSYGPGRYDAAYEEKGLDYPIGYVRWTENRNMEEFLHLVAKGTVRVSPFLAESTYPVDDAPSAYRALADPNKRPMVVVLEYSADPNPSQRRMGPTAVGKLSRGKVRLGLIGAGGFARGMYLPLLASLQGLIELRAVASRTGHVATSVATQYGCAYAASDYREVIDDADIDAVLIATRHDSHAEIALAALRRGKHVLVEKPLTIKREDLDAFRDFYADASKQRPILLTGFNRRFSSHALAIREAISRRSAPLMMDYRMNAGYLPGDHWVHGDEGGGRNIGEACHIYDLFTFLVESPVRRVSARSIRPASGQYSARDNFVASIEFEEGSVASLTYTALGSPAYSKEKLEVFSDGKVITLDDYKRVSMWQKQERTLSNGADKGHRQQVAAFAKAVLHAEPWPVPLWQQLQAMEIAFAVDSSLEA